MNKTLTILVGLPRSGKSTWIEKNKGNSIVVSNDWIRENILGGSYASTANAIVWTLGEAAMRMVLSQDKDVIFDAVNHTKEVRKFYVDIARKYDAKIKMVVFMTPLGICLVRNEIPSSHKLPNKALIDMHDVFSVPDEDEYDEVEFCGGCSIKKVVK